MPLTVLGTGDITVNKIVTWSNFISLYLKLTKLTLEIAGKPHFLRPYKLYPWVPNSGFGFKHVSQRG